MVTIFLQLLLIVSLVNLMADALIVPRTANWSSNGTVVAGMNIISLNNSNGIAIDNDDNLYIADSSNYRIVVVPLKNTSNITTFGSGPGAGNEQFLYPTDVFIMAPWIFVLDGGLGRVVRWSNNLTNPRNITRTSLFSSGYSMFIDSKGNLYVSDNTNHSIMCYLVNNTAHVRVAGTGVGGNGSDALNSPRGIFVDYDFTVYIADKKNHRIQKWSNGSTSGITVAGTGISGANLSQLSFPSSVLVDIWGNMFITDTGNNRIVKWAVNATEGICLVPCTLTPPIQLSSPVSLAFDSQGSIYVSDYDNRRVVKFQNLNIIGVSTTTTTSTAITSTTMMVSCSSRIISLSPDHPSVLFPMEIRRSEHFSISSTFNVNCVSNLKTAIEWTIEQCSDSLCSIRRSIQGINSLSLTLSELYIPARFFEYGIYRFTLNAFNSSMSIYVKIISSSILVRLMPFNVMTIRQGQQQSLMLDPGSYSIDPDRISFQQTEWNYLYFYHIYGSNNSQRILTNISQSFLIIPRELLRSNQTYHFQVEIINIWNSSLTFIGNLLVEIVDENQTQIVIQCLIKNLCQPKDELQRMDPTNQQLTLISNCFNHCHDLNVSAQIEWSIYYGSIDNLVNGVIEWKQLNNTEIYQNLWLFGINTNTFTTTKDLFLTYSSINYWRFQVMYWSNRSSIHGIGIINFIVNRPPINGTCQMNVINQTVRINCSNWFDVDGIKDYSYFLLQSSTRLMLGYSTSSQIEIELPAGQNLTLIVRIRDTFDSSSEFILSPINIELNPIQMIDILSNKNQWFKRLYVGNQNIVCQLLIVYSQLLKILTEQNLKTAWATNMSLASLSVSPLYKNDENDQGTFNWTNRSTISTGSYTNQTNHLAVLREFLITFINTLTIVNIDSIILQAGTLAQLTLSTNELTREALSIASARCLLLATILFNIDSTVSFEDVQLAVTHISRCFSHVLTGVNAPLQSRSIVLQLDLLRANTVPIDYDTDLEFPWSNLYRFGDNDDFSIETIEKNRNLFYQDHKAKKIFEDFENTISIITNILTLHLNVGQNITINTSSVIISLVHENSTVTSRSILTPLSIRGNRSIDIYSRYSHQLSWSFLNDQNEEISVRSKKTNSFEFFIDRDPNVPQGEFVLQNVTVMEPNGYPFKLHLLNISKWKFFSIHLEIQPIDFDLSYLIVHRFDEIPLLNSSIRLIDGWTLFCPSNADHLMYFIDNEQNRGFETIFFGIRELNETEIDFYCSNRTNSTLPMTDEPMNFTSNYLLRSFLSGCYYLDENAQWRSDGLRVGPMTTINRTQCFSTHLTTFTSALVLLPTPINWIYVFANANFSKNKTIYLTVIITVVIYILLLIYSRHQDKKADPIVDLHVLSNPLIKNRYYYQIVVFTGRRIQAGTTARVQLIISGDENQTDAITLNSSADIEFDRGSVRSFLLGQPKKLGNLSCVRIWHDNTGSNSSWYLNYLVIRDLQTMEKSYFICQQWLTIDETLERFLPAANDVEQQNLSYLFSKKGLDSLNDRHLWFSIFLRPHWTRFTRFQRCTCCFVLLFLMMLMDIVYYDKIAEIKSKKSIRGFIVDSLIVTREEILIGIVVDLLAFVPSIFLVQFFRRVINRRENNRFYLLIGYVISILLIGTSIFFIVARGIELGDEKSQKWFKSLIVAFLSTFFLSEPIKILFFTIIFTVIYRSTDEKENFYLNGKVRRQNHSFRSQIRPIRLREQDVMIERENRQRQRQQRSFVRDLFVKICSVILIVTLVGIYDDRNSFLHVQHLRRVFVDRRFTEIVNVEQFWRWIDESFLSNIRTNRWYNGDSARFLNGFIDDKTHRLIGWPVISQKRDDQQLFRTSVHELRGSLSDLRTNLTFLHRFSWIDNRTRLVTLRFTLYNPNSRVYTLVRFFAEFSPAGGIETSSRFEPIRLFLPLSFVSIIFALIYYLFVIYLMIIEFCSFIRAKRIYFHSIWSYVNLAIVLSSWIKFAIFFRFSNELIRLDDQMRQTHGHETIHFDSLIFFNDLFRDFLGLCAFFNTIKLLQLARCHRRLFLWHLTLKYAMKDLFNFLLLFSNVFIAFVCLFYLLFSSKLFSCSSLLQTSKMLFEILLLKFDGQGLHQADRYLGPLIFTLFVYLMVFVGMTMFISIVHSAFQRARDEYRYITNEDEENLRFLFSRIQTFFGRINHRQNELNEERMRSRYRHTFEYFPEKIDQFSDIIDQIMMNR